MFYFIEEIIRGKTKFNWAGMISNYLHEQFVVIKRTSQFYMTSYLVYLLADPIHIEVYLEHKAQLWGEI